MQTANEVSGRVLRVGSGWVDVAVEQKVIRVKSHPALLLRPGSHVLIKGEYATVPSQPARTAAATH